MTQSRQLAAIMFTDIVGFTALMGKDEKRTLDILAKNRQIHHPIIEEYNGRFIKELGDGILAVFSTVSEAVIAATEIMKACNEANEFQLCIGIHQGEVVFENDDVFGNDVNIAARIQSAATPGSIFVSETVHNSIANKKGIKTHFVKNAHLKNVKDPMNLFSVSMDISPSNQDIKSSRKSDLLKTLIPSGILIIGILLLVVFTKNPSKALTNDIEFINDKNETESVSLIKENYEIKIGIGKFINTNEIDSLNWMIYGIRGALKLDLEYGDLITCPTYYNDLTSETPIANILEDGSWNDLDYVLLGSFKYLDNNLEITCRLHDSSGRIVFDQKFISNNEFELFDSISSTIYNYLEIPPELEIRLDYPLNELSTSSVEALQLYSNATGHPLLQEKSYLPGRIGWMFNKIFEIDTSFAQAYLSYSRNHPNPDRARMILENGLQYRKKLRKRDQLNFLMEYHLLKGDTMLAVNLANKIISKNPKSYSRINTALNLMKRIPGQYEMYKRKSIDIFDKLDFQKKLTLVDIAAFRGDSTLIPLVIKQVESDPLNYLWQERLLSILYGSNQIAECRSQIDIMISLFPEQFENLSLVKVALNNIGISIIDGEFTRTGGHYRNYKRNKFGLLFELYNERHYSFAPRYETSRDTIFYLFGNNVTKIKLHRYKNKKVKYIEFISRLGTVYAHIPLEIRPVINEFVFEGIISFDLDELIDLHNRNNEHDILRNIIDHKRYISKNENNTEILGIYDDGVEILSEGNKIIRKKNEKNGFSVKRYLYPLNDSIYLNSESLWTRSKISKQNNRLKYSEFRVKASQ